MPDEFAAPHFQAIGEFAGTELADFLEGNPLVANFDQLSADAKLIRARDADDKAKAVAREQARASRLPQGPARPEPKRRILNRPPDPILAFRADTDGFKRSIEAAERIEWMPPEPVDPPEAPFEPEYPDEVSRLAWQLSEDDRAELVASLTALAETSDLRGRPDLEEKFRQQIRNIIGEPQEFELVLDAGEIDVGQEVEITAEEMRQELLRLQGEAEAVGRGDDFVLTVDEIEGLNEEVVRQVYEAIGVARPVTATLEGDEGPELTPQELEEQIQILPVVPTAPRPPTLPRSRPASPSITPPGVPKAPEFSFDPTKPLIDQIGSEIARCGVVNLSEGANGVKSILRSFLGNAGNLDGRFTQGGFIFAGENLMVEGMNVNISGTLTQASDGKKDFLSLGGLLIEVNGGNMIQKLKASVMTHKLDKTDQLEEMIRKEFNEQFLQENRGVTIDSLQLSLDLGAQVLRGTIHGQ